MDEQGPLPCPFDAATIEVALDALLTNPRAKLSDRNKRFLSFVVGEALGGRADRIKAYAIGVDAFGRGEGFDPSSDPIVRIEATRLRSALAQYYDGLGAADVVRFVLRPGNYVPAFEVAPRVTRETARDPAPAAVPHLTLVVIHQTDPADRAGTAYGELLVDAIVRRVRAGGARVIPRPPHVRTAAMRSLGNLFRNPRNVHAIDVAVHALATGRRFSWRLSDLATGEALASGCRDRTGDGPPEALLIDELAEAVTMAAVSVLPASHAAHCCPLE